MNRVPLKQCIDAASDWNDHTMAPFPVPENKTINIYINGWLTPFHAITSKIYIIGHPGLQIDRFDASVDTDTTYAAPKNIQ
jgi:hypothetical protein